MNHNIRRYKETISLFTQESKIEEKTVKRIDNNGNEFEIIDHVQFPDYMGVNINILIK
jgi:hypothetical protein